MKITDLPVHYNCVDILEHNLVKRAGKVALYSLERQMTFRQVSQEVNQVGNALKKLGVRIGDFVALLSLDLPECVTSFFGILKVGGVAVGMSTTLTPPEYAYMLDDSRARVLLIPEANPAWPDIIEPSTVVLRGTTVIPIESPNKTRAGK